MLNIGDFGFVELKNEKVKEDYSNPVSPYTTLGMMTNMTAQNRFITCAEPEKYKVGANDVTSSMLKGLYNFDTKYIIIYLYDFYNDDVSKDFIRVYGGLLHNRTSNNITILTLYSKEMTQGWSNIYNRDRINPSLHFDMPRIKQMYKRLMEIYDVKELPTMIVISNDNGNEKSFNIPILNLNKDSIFAKFDGVIEFINNYCEQDLDVIGDQILGRNNQVRAYNNFKSFNITTFIENLMENEKQKLGRKYSITKLAAEIGYGSKMLSNYIYKNNKYDIPRDVVFCIAARFNLSLKELDSFLNATNNSLLTITGRDGLIKDCLLKNLSIDEIEKKLKDAKYEGIKKIKKVKDNKEKDKKVRDDE